MVPSTLPGMSSPTSPGPLHLRGVLLDGTAEGERVGELWVTAEGRIAAKGYQEFGQHFPRPGWVEHAPEEIWQATLEATRSALEQYDGPELRSVGITNQRGTRTAAHQADAGPEIGADLELVAPATVQLRHALLADRIHP